MPQWGTRLIDVKRVHRIVFGCHINDVVSAHSRYGYTLNVERLRENLAIDGKCK